MAPSLDYLFPSDPLLYNSTSQSFTGLDNEYYSQGLRERFQLDALKPLVNNVNVSQYADIEYTINEDKYYTRQEKAASLIAAGKLPTAVPEGWPKAVTGPLCWAKDGFPDENQYIYYMTDADKAEIVAALKHFKELELSGDEVDRDNFPLPNLGKQLDKVCQTIYEGHGFAIVRGLDPDAYSEADLAVVYLAISSYVGERRGKQDQRGSMLMHVIKKDDESGNQYNLDKVSLIRSDKELLESLRKPFHTDTVTDTLCLFTRAMAASGGMSILASAWTVYNELAATRPDLIHVLSKPDWPFDTFGRNPPYYKRALLYHHQGKIIMSFSRRLLVGHPPHTPRTPGIPGLTEAQAEALDAVHFVARKHEVTTSMMAGDIRFLNNMGVLHRREAFENSTDRQRHLIRLWLNNEMMCWKLPAALRIAWARVFDDTDREGKWDIVPPRKDGVILRIAGSCD